MLLPSRAEAVPGFSRLYDKKCVTCHAPAPPRLNNLGIAFKRAGYRFPDADDAGRLIFKSRALRETYNDFTPIVTTMFTLRGNPAGEPRRAVRIDEVEFFGGGPLGQRFSYHVMGSPHSEEERGPTLERLEAQYNFGSVGRPLAVRVGKFDPLIWQKGLHQRLGLSDTPLFSAHFPAGGFEGFTFHSSQKLVELSQTWYALREGGVLQSTVVSASLLNGVNALGEDRGILDGSHKDVLFQAVHLFGEQSSVTAFSYWGRAFTDPNGLVGGPFRNSFRHTGVAGNYTFEKSRLDLVAGLLFGRTTSPEISRTLSSTAQFAEVTYSPRDTMGLALRFDRVRPGDGETKAYTFAVTKQTSNHLVVTIELQRRSEPGGNRNVAALGLRLMP